MWKLCEGLLGLGVISDLFKIAGPSKSMINITSGFARSLIGGISLLLISPISSGSDNSSYLTVTKPFIAVEDVNREAEAWATCAASYDVLAELYEPGSARKKQFQQLANGAEISVSIAFVINDISDDVTPDRFSAMWEYAKLAGQEMPNTSRTAILADSERLGEKGSKKFFNKLINTVELCMKNLNKT